ncbi:hypothetical protein [Nocardiopsis suaedae]|uniref:Uncharacterized protein n=1 Tax=Nocardiopsis suaedae TaxID=3018444 RepID=A0ABT4TGM7_9ACTN|nr:hypothetical protein [Nocardiopsis suaedae]MDA2803805.1 hypothetical protein [Nocardiopsis suaedae]
MTRLLSRSVAVAPTSAANGTLSIHSFGAVFTTVVPGLSAGSGIGLLQGAGNADSAGVPALEPAGERSRERVLRMCAMVLPALVERLPGLRLEAPASELPYKHDVLVFGLHSLPVSWGGQQRRPPRTGRCASARGCAS